MSRKGSAGLLNPKQLRFIAEWSGNSVEAARRAGYANPDKTACRIVQHPAIKKALEEKQRALAEASGKDLGEKITVTRDEIISGLAMIGRSGTNEHARVRAWGELAEIFAMKVKQTRDVTNLFDGWSDAELEAYSLRGELPQRLKGSQGASPASY